MHKANASKTPSWSFFTSASSIETDVDGIAAERQGESGAVGLQAQPDALGVLQEELATAEVADRQAIASLDIGASEVVDIVEIVDRARRGHARHANAADTEAADGEIILAAVVVQRPAAQVAAADEGNLDLL